MRLEEVFIVFYTTSLDRVGREPRWRKRDCLGVSVQSECETLQQENQDYVRNDHHNEDVGRYQNV
jgi:uncharacterized protein YfaT (DUF1175 family)